MTTTALVGPLPQVRFHDGTRVVHTPPRGTCDPRYAACTDHHVACDCREAEFAELLGETRSTARDNDSYRDMAKAIARLHAPVDNEYVGRYCAACFGSTPWPCPTYRLVAEVDWYASWVMESGELA